ncbi:MAG: hypothetical protein JRD89_10155 [Deltaproteobacteria bacterium]|nr:hypothetical protein [Deltaproteobacteria bacterium]
MAMQLPSYEQWLAERLTWFERLREALSPTDERLDFIALTLIDLYRLLSGEPVPAPAPPAATPLEELIGTLNSLNENLAALIVTLGGEVPKVPSFEALLSKLNFLTSAVVHWGKAASGGDNTLIDRNQFWQTNIWAGYELAIVEGKGAGQTRIIESNDENRLVTTADWTTRPDSTSVYVIRLARYHAIEKVSEHNAAVTAATDILSSDITPSNPPSLFRVMTCFSAAGVFSARVTRDSTTVGVEFNSGSDLIADGLYLFDMAVHDGDSVNFRYSADATMRLMRVSEIVRPNA